MHYLSQTPVFIVSTGRCGSTLVSKLLGNQPEICSISEFWPNRVNLQELFAEDAIDGSQYWDLLSVPMSPDIFKIALVEKTQVEKRVLHETNYMRRIALPSLLEDYDDLFNDIKHYTMNLPKRKPADHILCIFEFIKKKLKRKFWVERTGANLDFLPRWRRMWPEAKFIHIYRDGRNCALSMSRHPAFRQQIIRTDVNNDVSFYNIIPVDPDSFTIEEYRKTVIPLERFGELWNKMIMNGMDQLEKIPSEQKLMFSYENLIASPEIYLKKLIAFIDPDLEHDDWINRQHGILHDGHSKWEALPALEISRLTESCRAGLERLNYL